MSESNVDGETVHQQSNPDDYYDDENDSIDISNPGLKRERAFLIQSTLLAEQQWFQNIEIIEIFSKLENILRTICKRMKSNKVDLAVKVDVENPMTEKFLLVQRTGAEVFKCSVMLLGESVIQTEVTMKYTKIPGGFYRGTAQPDIQWKLQQLQDANNYYAQALSMLVQKLKWIRQMPPDSINMMPSNIINIVAKVISLIGQARSTLCLPEKRTFLELCNSVITRCFNPPLPPDMVFSYYICTNRLVCAAYQVSPKTNGTQGVTVTLADCLLPQLVDALFLTDRALNVAQQFTQNMRMFRERINTYTYICS